ncbi:Acg family FMN-binding oxidoreductase [Nocardioides pacificus]
MSLAGLVRHAVRAPSGHNSQPWRFEVEGERLLLRPDRRRALPVVDPEDRELTISCGAALGHLRVAIGHAGHVGDVRVVADDALFASVGWGPKESGRAGSGDQGLFAAIESRVTDRGPYDARAVPPEVLDRLAQDSAEEGVGLLLIGDADRPALTDLVVEGDRLQFADRAFRRELAAWMRPNHSSQGLGMPGWVHGLGAAPALVGPLVMRAVDLGESQARRDLTLAAAAPVLAVLTTAGDSVADWLATGQALSTLVLRAASWGLSVSYLNQPVEVKTLRPRLAELVDGATPQLVLRLGYGVGRPPTPRLPVADVLGAGGD